jgi:hypothetical protein
MMLLNFCMCHRVPSHFNSIQVSVFNFEPRSGNRGVAPLYWIREDKLSDIALRVSASIEGAVKQVLRYAQYLSTGV